MPSFKQPQHKHAQLLPQPISAPHPAATTSVKLISISIAAGV
jgi:hypothetical protein